MTFQTKASTSAAALLSSSSEEEESQLAITPMPSTSIKIPPSVQSVFVSIIHHIISNINHDCSEAKRSLPTSEILLKLYPTIYRVFTPLNTFNAFSNIVYALLKLSSTHSTNK